MARGPGQLAMYLKRFPGGKGWAHWHLYPFCTWDAGMFAGCGSCSVARRQPARGNAEIPRLVPGRVSLSAARSPAAAQTHSLQHPPRPLVSASLIPTRAPSHTTDLLHLCLPLTPVPLLRKVDWLPYTGEVIIFIVVRTLDMRSTHLI